MLKRIVTAVIGVLILVIILALPEIVFHIAVCVMIAGMLYEILRALRTTALLWCISAISAILVIIGVMTAHIAPCFILSITLYLLSAIALHGKNNINTVLASGFLTWFITLFMSTLILLYHQYDLYGILIVFVCAWGTDTCAYFGGKFFGRHKLIPHVSPKKTIEGAIGGVIGAILLCVFYAWLLTQWIGFTGSLRFYLMFALLGLTASVMAQFGDLAASALKRDCGIKDFGTLFPGHGGILDRFDSVILIAPFIYYFITYFSVLS